MLGVLNTVADVVVTTTDEVINGGFAPVLVVFQTGKNQFGRCGKVIFVSGLDGVNPNELVVDGFSVRVTAQGNLTGIGDLVGFEDLEEMDGNTVYTGIRQMGVGRTGNLGGTG